MNIPPEKMHNLEIKKHSRVDLLLLRSSDFHSFRKLQRDVDEMGLLSSTEQHLSGILTTLDNITDQDNTLYVTAIICLPSECVFRTNNLVSLNRRKITQGTLSYRTCPTCFFPSHQCLTQEGELIGMLKIGTKRLYLYNGKDLHCRSCACLLDFYIQRNFRKRGLGLELFNFMLKDKAISPSRLCYDNPSYKLQSFLKKHFSPCALIKQPNNFVIFAEYFGEPEMGPFGQ
ncbi:alpha-tubulin N-acetyltransferase, putative [Plasmodium knowlesi strain H]|uniref:Alpha-tubulin N-acetyltransferase n=1 Tax=Plasmodium knowlesi (strain H) TaxID=5851 RepID=A0A193R1K2_PLAKH|nr:alpha-tubulin N-acetyltransferase, putative [Plasmodium knowlesi strain H]